MTESGLKKIGFVHSWEDRWDLDLKPYVSEKATSDEEYGACWYMDEEYGGYIYIGDDNEMEGLNTKRMLDYLDGLGVPVYDMLMEDTRKRTRSSKLKENMVGDRYKYVVNAKGDVDFHGSKAENVIVMWAETDTKAHVFYMNGIEVVLESKCDLSAEDILRQLHQKTFPVGEYVFDTMLVEAQTEYGNLAYIHVDNIPNLKDWTIEGSDDDIRLELDSYAKLRLKGLGRIIIANDFIDRDDALFWGEDNLGLLGTSLDENKKRRGAKRFKENKAFETLLAKKDNGEKLRSSDFYDVVFEIANKFGGPSSELNRLINEADFEMIDDYGWELSEEYIRMAIEKGPLDEEEAHTVLLAIWEMDGKNLKRILRELGL